MLALREYSATLADVSRSRRSGVMLWRCERRDTFHAERRWRRLSAVVVARAPGDYLAERARQEAICGDGK